jgi:hypothetical protein
MGLKWFEWRDLTEIWWERTWGHFMAHDGSMVLLYMVTWIPSIYIPAPWILWMGIDGI